MPVRQAVAQVVLVCVVVALGAVTLLGPSTPGRPTYTAASAATAAPGDVAASVTTAIADPAPVQPTNRVVRVGKGDTLMDILVKEGVSRTQAHAAITALEKVFNPRKLRAGQELTITFGPYEDGGAGKTGGLELAGGPEATGDVPRGDREASGLLALRFEPDFDHEVGAERNGDGFAPIEIRKEFTTQAVRAGGTIETSLFEAAKSAGVPAKVLIAMIRAFSYDVDFQRDIRPGDSFEVMFEKLVDSEGEVTRTGEVLYAALTLSGTRLPIYRYTPKKGEADFFTDKGESVRKALLRTPVDGARLSSRYGKRRHPVLGYKRKHRGIDFAAPPGTPIVAAGNGVVAMAGRNGNFGNYIQIRHNSEFSTGYAHMRRFAKGVRKGKRVKQGQVIGYVGSTGLSTGPHLHFEMIRNKRRINPLSVKLPTGRRLKGAELESFLVAKAALDRAFANLPATIKVAKNQSPGQ